MNVDESFAESEDRLMATDDDDGWEQAAGAAISEPSCYCNKVKDMIPGKDERDSPGKSPQVTEE